MAKQTAYKQALEFVQRRYPGLTSDEYAESAHDLVIEWRKEAARERDENGIEDSPCLENCDDAGTGEGRCHGRM